MTPIPFSTPSSWATPHLYEVMKEKDALYEKPDFSEEDGMRASRA